MAKTDRFDLPDGEWAELYLARKIPESKRRVIQDRSVAMAHVLPSIEIPTIDVQGEVPPADQEPGPFGAPPIAQMKAEAEEAAKNAARKINTRDISPDALPAVDAYGDALILAYVKEWSFDLALVTEDGEPNYKALLELDEETYDALRVECDKRSKGTASEGGVGSEAVNSPDALVPTSP